MAPAVQSPPATIFAQGMRRAILPFAVFVAPAWMWASFESRFVPNTLGFQVALSLAGVIAFIAGLWAATSPLFSRDTPGFVRVANVAPFLEQKRTRALGISAIAFVSAFAAIQRGYLDWWTQLAGSPRQETMHVSSYSRGSARSSSCPGFNLIESPYLLGTAVCADLGFGGPPPGTPVTLYGKVSLLGISVSTFNISRASRGLTARMR